MSYIINLIDDTIQNTPMETNDDLVINGYDLSQWAFATDEQVATWQFKQAQHQAYNINQVNYDQFRLGIYNYTMNDGTVIPLNIDSTSSCNIVGMVTYVMYNMSLGNNTGSVTWYDDNNNGNIFTYEEFLKLGITASKIIDKIQTTLSSNKLAIASCTTIDELNALNLKYTINISS